MLPFYVKSNSKVTKLGNLCEQILDTKVLLQINSTKKTLELNLSVWSTEKNENSKSNNKSNGEEVF